MFINVFIFLIIYLCTYKTGLDWGNSFSSDPYEFDVL